MNEVFFSYFPQNVTHKHKPPPREFESQIFFISTGWFVLLESLLTPQQRSGVLIPYILGVLDRFVLAVVIID